MATKMKKFAQALFVGAAATAIAVAPTATAMTDAVAPDYPAADPAGCFTADGTAPAVVEAVDTHPQQPTDDADIPAPGGPAGHPPAHQVPDGSVAPGGTAGCPEGEDCGTVGCPPGVDCDLPDVDCATPGVDCEWELAPHLTP